MSRISSTVHERKQAEIRVFAQLPDDAPDKCRGLQGSRCRVLDYIASVANRLTHTAWVNLTATANKCGIHRGTASKARADLLSVDVVEVLEVCRVRGFLLRLVFRRAARRNPTQIPLIRSSKNKGARGQLQRLIAQRIDEVVQTHPRAVEERKRRAMFDVNLRGIPANKALYDLLCDLVEPGFRLTAQALERRSVSPVMADLLARAFKLSRIESVLAYCDRKRYREGGIVGALLEGWATG
jgi:hypothetical protein